MTRDAVHAVITGGGTGGHVTPALAIADALVEAGHDPTSLRFAGARRGLEATAVPEAGYAIELMTLDGIQRSLRPRDVLRSLRAVLDVLVAVVTALRWQRRHRPAVVVGVGGYASAPAVIAARLRRVPTVVHEQNAVPGLVNRIAVRCGARAAVSFPGGPWPDAVVTGNPVRAAVRGVRRRPEDPPRLTIVGGSLGAGRLNDVGLGLYDRWRHRRDVAVRHVAGRAHHASCRERLDALRAPDDVLDYELVEYEHDMASVYERSALLLCRAGATTVAEAAVAGIGAVYVPWAGSAEGQQVANAAAMVEAGGGVMVRDAECTVERVAPIVESLLADPAARAALDAAARTLGRPDAAARVAALVEEAAAGG